MELLPAASFQTPGLGALGPLSCFVAKEAQDPGQRMRCCLAQAQGAAQRMGIQETSLVTLSTPGSRGRRAEVRFPPPLYDPLSLIFPTGGKPGSPRSHLDAPLHSLLRLSISWPLC